METRRACSCAEKEEEPVCVSKAYDIQNMCMRIAPRHIICACSVQLIAPWRVTYQRDILITTFLHMRFDSVRRARRRIYYSFIHLLPATGPGRESSFWENVRFHIVQIPSHSPPSV